jgi:hypothetical protein
MTLGPSQRMQAGTCPNGIPLCQPAARRVVGVPSVAGPGCGLSEEPAVGVGPVTLDCRVPQLPSVVDIGQVVADRRSQLGLGLERCGDLAGQFFVCRGCRVGGVEVGLHGRDRLGVGGRVPRRSAGRGSVGLPPGPGLPVTRPVPWPGGPRRCAGFGRRLVELVGGSSPYAPTVFDARPRSAAARSSHGSEFQRVENR